MQRANFTLDDTTLTLLDQLARKYYGGNKSEAVRAAIESLAAHVGHEGWVISGYTPMTLEGAAVCHSCKTHYASGAVLFRPAFARGEGPEAFPELPAEDWLDCGDCVRKH